MTFLLVRWMVLSAQKIITEGTEHALAGTFQSSSDFLGDDKDRIPAFHLYGEREELADFLHCERIVARAAKHGWSIAAHRHANLHQFFWVKDRAVILNLEGRRHRLAAGRVVSLPIYTVHGFEFEPRTQGLVVTVAQHEVNALIERYPILASSLSQPRIITSQSTLADAFTNIEREFNRHDNWRSLGLRAAFLALVSCLARAAAPSLSKGGRAQDRVTQFLHAARRAFAEGGPVPSSGHKVQDFASQLGISPAHLNRLCQEVSGQSPGALIEAVRLQEAKRLLAYTRMTIAEVGYRLGFEDPSYFARAFKRGQGVSPKAYRQQLEAASEPVGKAP